MVYDLEKSRSDTTRIIKSDQGPVANLVIRHLRGKANGIFNW